MFHRMLALSTVGLAGILTAAVGLAQQTTPLDRAGKTVVAGNNDFAFDLYAQLREDRGNLFFSPYSISNALAMTYEGAKGQTAEQMAQTLHLGLPQKELSGGFAQLIRYLNQKTPERAYQLSVANALWGQKGYTFLPAFLKVTEEQYRAGLKEVDFAGATEAARQTINGWVEKQTNNRIKDLIKKGVLAADTRLVLTNAIYFKAPWYEAFSEQYTKPAPFTKADGSMVQVPTMNRTDMLSYTEGDNFQMVAIPYKGGELSMIVLLPKKVNGLADLEKSLTAANVDAWLKKMTKYQVSLKLPKFTTTAEFNLKKVLSKMGMPLAFSDQADFSGMTTVETLKIDEVIHKAFVAVDEKGTEAAAATAVIMRPTSAIINPNKANFHADHPFTFLIRENRTGSILFMGRTNDPQP